MPETRAQPERALPFVLSDPNRGARSRERTSAPTEREGYFVMPSRLTVATPEQERWRELGLTCLLACLLLLIFAVTPLVELGVIGRLAASVLWALPSVLAVLVVSRHPAALAVILAATAAGLATAIVDRSSPLSAVVARGSAVVALGVLSGVIAIAVFGPGRVTWRRIQGGVALYLTVALLFAHLYGLLVALVPQALSNVPIGLDSHSVFYRGRLLYFSVVTLTTTGYGDIVPLHPVARSLATLEAVIGQLFPATLLARLVTLELQGRRPSDQP